MGLCRMLSVCSAGQGTQDKEQWQRCEFLEEDHDLGYSLGQDGIYDVDGPGACVCACVPACARAYVRVCARACVRVRVGVYMRVCVLACVRVFVNVCVHACACIRLLLLCKLLSPIALFLLFRLLPCPTPLSGLYREGEVCRSCAHDRFTLVRLFSPIISYLLFANTHTLAHAHT